MTCKFPKIFEIIWSGANFIQSICNSILLHWTKPINHHVDQSFLCRQTVAGMDQSRMSSDVALVNFVFFFIF